MSEARTRVETNEPCPNCGQEIVRLEVTDLPRYAIMVEMFDVCALDADDLEKPYWGNTVIAYHKDMKPRAEVVQNG